MQDGCIRCIQQDILSQLCDGLLCNNADIAPPAAPEGPPQPNAAPAPADAAAAPQTIDADALPVGADGVNADAGSDDEAQAAITALADERHADDGEGDDEFVAHGSGDDDEATLEEEEHAAAQDGGQVCRLLHLSCTS